MSRMRVASINKWGDGGIQVNYELAVPEEGISMTHTEMAQPVSKVEFDRLMNLKLYEQFDIDGVKVVKTP